MALPIPQFLANLAGSGLSNEGPAVSGGPAHFGGISVGSKVVGSGSATTVPPPQTTTEGSFYTAATGNQAAALFNSPNLPLIAVLAALVLAAVFVVFPRRK